MDLKTFIHDMPEVELHVHLKGCLTPSLAETLARRNGIPLPGFILRSSCSEEGDGELKPSGDGDDGGGGVAAYAFHDLASFLAVYHPAMQVLLTERDFHDLAWD